MNPSGGHVIGALRDAFWKSGAGGFALIIVLTPSFSIADAIRLGRVLTELAWMERATNVSAAHEHAREGEKLLRGALDGRLNKNHGFSEIVDTQSRLGGALVVLAFMDPALNSNTREPMLSEAEALLQTGHTEDMQA